MALLCRQCVWRSLLVTSYTTCCVWYTTRVTCTVCPQTWFSLTAQEPPNVAALMWLLLATLGQLVRSYHMIQVV